jgi:hypothetical protein
MTIFVALMLSLLAGGAFAQALQNVELHGYVQNRFYANPSASTRFVTERVSLSAVAKLADTGLAYVEVYYHPWYTNRVIPSQFVAPNPSDPSTYGTAEEARTYLESAYVDLPLGAGRIRLGKGRQLNFGLTPSYPNRKTSQYGILSETFTQDRIVGAQFSMKSGTLDGGCTLFTDQPVWVRKIGDFAGAVTATDIVQHLADRDVPGATSGRLAFAARFGVTTPTFQAHVSGCVGGLNRSQLLPVSDAFNRVATNTNTDHNKFGVDTIYSAGRFVAQGEWYTGKFSFVELSGYSVLVGYQPKDKMRAYVRWSAMDSNQSPILAKTASWPVQQLTFGVIQPIAKGIWAELDYEKNMASEPTGSANIDNDLLFLEIFTGF